jgi:hypothetical protein
LRFAVRRLARRQASSRGHSPSGRDVARCVDIRVRGESAGTAPEDGLALARLWIHGPAPRTHLTRMVWRHQLDAPDCLALQPPHEGAPGVGEDSSVESGFLAHVSAGSLDGSSCRSSHAPDVELLQSDDVEPSGDVGRGLLHPVLATASLAHLDSCNGRLDPGASVRPAPPPGKCALEPTQSSLFDRAQPWAGQKLARGQRGGHDNTTVDSDDLTVTWSGDWIRHDREGNVPTTCTIPGDPIGLRRRQRSGEPTTNPSDLGEEHARPLSRRPLHPAGLPADDAETLVPPGLAPRRAAMGPAVEVPYGLVEVPERLLLDSLRTEAQPVERRAELGQLTALLGKSRRRPPPFGPHRPLLHGQVPHESRVCAVLQQHRLLHGRGIQAKSGHALNRTTDHRHPKGGKWRILPALQDRVPRHSADESRTP